MPLSGGLGPNVTVHRKPRWKEERLHRAKKHLGQSDRERTDLKRGANHGKGGKALGTGMGEHVHSRNSTSTHMTSMQREVVGIREYRHHLGCSLFVGGLAPGISGGMLQQHLQQFA